MFAGASCEGDYGSVKTSSTVKGPGAALLPLGAGTSASPALPYTP